MKNTKSMLHRRKCQECSVLIKNQIFRCASCIVEPNYDLCTQCFENNICSILHSECIFVKADLKRRSQTVQWEAAQRFSDSNVIPSNNHLQYRDFDDHDYDALLALDNQKIQPLHHHLMLALKSVDLSVEIKGQCAICSGSYSHFQQLKYLNCIAPEKHIAHESCIIDLLIEAQATKTYGNAGAQCPACQSIGLKTWIFPMLVDDPIVDIHNKKRDSIAQKNKVSYKPSIVHTRHAKKLESGDKKCADLCILGSSRHLLSNQKVDKKNDASLSSGSSPKLTNYMKIGTRKTRNQKQKTTRRNKLLETNHLSLDEIEKSISLVGYNSKSSYQHDRANM